MHTSDGGFHFPVSGSHRNASAGSQTGDTLGKALASVSTKQLMCVLVASTVRPGLKPELVAPQRCRAGGES